MRATMEGSMFDLKPLSTRAIPAALAKAERYRLLNEPEQAESICDDILAVDHDNQSAITMKLLALTDQFSHGGSHASVVGDAMALLPRFTHEYDRAYYRGLISERRARAHLARGGPGSGMVAYEWFVDAMQWFERADALRPPDNDDARLRWNACARTLERHRHLAAREEERDMPLMLE
jgi:hypothetical protein